MENFVIDLDKVLDEFEKSEDTKSSELSDNQPLISHFYGDSLKAKLPEKNFYHSALSESSEKINLADADFSASTSSLSPLTVTRTESEDVGSRVLGVVKDSNEQHAANGLIEKTVSVEVPFVSFEDVQNNFVIPTSASSNLKPSVIPPTHNETVPTNLPCDVTQEIEELNSNDRVENIVSCDVKESETAGGLSCEGLSSEPEPAQETNVVSQHQELLTEDLVNQEDLSDCQACNSQDQAAVTTFSAPFEAEIIKISPDCNSSHIPSDERHLEAVVPLPVVGFDKFAIEELSNADVETYLRDMEDDNRDHDVDPGACTSKSLLEDENEMPQENSLETVQPRETSSGLVNVEKVQQDNNVYSGGDVSVATEGSLIENELEVGSNVQGVDTENLVDGCDSSGDGPRDRLARPTSLNLLTRIGSEQDGSDVQSNGEPDVHGVSNLLGLLEDGQAPTLSEEEQLLGKLRPFWIPDTDAPNCMHCEAKFNFLKRRHHCRACGKVLCGQCCNGKAKLDYMENRESRVCCRCLVVLDKAQAIQRLWGGSPTNDTPSEPDGSPQLGSPNPNNPQEYCSTVSPLQQVQNGQPPPTVMVPIGVLKRGAFSPEYTLTDQPDSGRLMEWLQDEDYPPVVFALTKNLHVLVKIQKLDCCVNRQCWCFTSRGMCTVGQDDFMVILERLPEENVLPRDVFYVFSTVYDNAGRGNTVSDLGHVLFPEGVLGSREHSGFLFVRPTLQCLDQLHLPPAPYLVALLIQKWEIPWAKVFPLRLLLRIGSEFRYYPCPLVSIRFRKPVYGEIGHTIMSVLADFRNYHYTLPIVPGMEITMMEKTTTVSFPRGRYNQVLRTVTNSNEHVLGFGGNFSATADSHLVCVQTDDGNYQTQAINIQNTARKVTGASFIVFSGALKSTTGLTGKSSMVEDGLLIQIPNEDMAALKGALRDMRDFDVACGPTGAPEPDERVLLRWCEDDLSCNRGVKSVIDGRSLEGIDSVRVHAGTDYAADRHMIRWTEVFFLSSTCANERRIEASKIAEAVAQACCLALTAHLDILAEAEMTKIGLRVSVDSEKVGYDVGAREMQLSGSCMSDLDSSLIPVITGISTAGLEDAILLELIFHILLK